MNGRLYIFLALFLMVLDAWVGTFFWMYLGNMSFNSIYLVLFLILDLIFISTNIRKLGFTSFELSVISLLIFHLMLGLFILPHFNDSYSELRALKDTLLPIMFLFKCVIFRKIFNAENFQSYKSLLIKSCILIVSVQALLLFFKPDVDTYVGINPPINILMASYFSGGSIFLLLLSFIAILLAGKRSILISMAIAAVIVSRKMGRLTFLFFISAGIGYIILFFTDISKIPLVDKFVITFDAIKEVFEDGLTSEQGQIALFIATGGRSAEIIAITSFMEPINWVIGTGSGYSFELIRPEEETIQIANAHFTPISIGYKFGLIIALYFLFYVSKNIVWGLKNNEIFIPAMLILFLVQSFFSFNIFAEILYPIFVSWLMILRKNKKVLIRN